MIHLQRIEMLAVKYSRIDDPTEKYIPFKEMCMDDYEGCFIAYILKGHIASGLPDDFR